MAASTDPIPLADRPWPSVSAVSAARTLLVPVGSTEQHGPHLPLDTDTRIAVALARGAAAHLPDHFLVAPAVAFGASGEHADFPGTLSIGTEVLQQVLVELGRSAGAFACVVFVNGHGGNTAALRAATSKLCSEGRAVSDWSWSVPVGDAHAGRTETSLLLAISPEVVHFDVAEAGRTDAVAELIGELRERGVRAVSPNGVLGDPAGASADEGRALLASCVDMLVGHLVAMAEGPSSSTTSSTDPPTSSSVNED